MRAQRIARASIAAALVALLSIGAHAQGNSTGLAVANCGAGSLGAGNPTPLEIDASGRLCVFGSSANISTAQVSVGTSATQIVSARAGRNQLVIANHGTTAVYIGGSGVATSTGILLPGTVGATITIPTSAAVYGIVASGSQTVGVLEGY
ncbi:MAG TPA: hypothetical protein VH684_11540 [Xanthobacteraceae bacterium]|jgi:hypothetical protein